MSTLIIAHISWRCTDKTRHTELLLILTHVDTCQHVLVIEEIFGQSLCQFGLTYARCSQENERRNGAIRVLKSCTTATNGIRNGFNSLVLSNHSTVQLSLQMQEFVALTLQHAAHRNAGPTAHHFGNIVRSHLFADQRPTLLLTNFLTAMSNIVIYLLHFAITNLGYTLVIPLAFGTFGLKFQSFFLLFQLRNLIHFGLLCLPTSTKRIHLILEFGNLFL